MLKRLAFVAILVAFGCAPQARGEDVPESARLSSGRVHFKTISVDDGLPHASVRALLQDRSGFIWIGTQDGLARYDGRSTDVFRRSRTDADSIGDNHIVALAEDRHGHLWIAHQAVGLSRYDPRTQRFVRYSGIRDGSGLPSPSIQQLFVDGEGSLWVTTSTGATGRWNEDKEHFEVPTFARDPQLPPVFAVASRAQGGLWLGTERGVWMWDGSSGKALATGLGPSGVINNLSADRHGNLWLATQQEGLWLVDAAGSAARVDVGSAVSGLSETLCLLVDSSDRLWAGTRAGLLILDTATHRLLSWQRHQADNPRGLAGDRVVSLTESKDGLIWVGTWSGGVSVHDPRTEAFMLVRELDDNALVLANQAAPAVLANADGSMWVARGYDGGLAMMDVEGHVLKHYRNDPADRSSIGSNFLMSLAHGSKGELWIGTGDAGIELLRAGAGGFEHFAASNTDPDALPAGGIRGMYVEPDGTLWVGGMGGGIASRCAECERFRKYAPHPEDPAGFPADGAYCFLRTRNGELWIGTRAHGILRLDDAASGKFSPIAGPVGAETGLSHGTVTYLLESADGMVWAGTQGGGLNRIMRDGQGRVQSVQWYTSDNGLSADAIGVILPDREGRLWVSATRGISRIDPKSGKIDGFEPRHGAQLTYYIGAGDTLPDGRLILGGFDGVTVFDPAAVVAAPETVQPVLTELRLFNQRVKPGPQAPIAQALSFSDLVTLDHRQNVVAFGFAAPLYRNAAMLGLSYRLEGRDYDWIHADPGQHTASYSGLAPGDYRFRVRAWTGVSDRQANETQVRLRVLPPPWATPWAYLAYTLALLIIGWAISWPMFARLRERRAARIVIENSEQRLKLALWGSGDEMWEYDLRDGHMRRDHHLPGLGPHEEGSSGELASFSERIHEADRNGYDTRLRAVSGNLTDTFEHSFRVRSEDGSWKWLQARGRVVARNDAGAPIRLAGTHQDITPLKLIEDRQQQLQETLRHQAFHDALTGLPNRALFYEQLTLCLIAPEAGGSRMSAVIITDLDEFKLLNDSLGPSAGDRLLCAVGERLRKLLPEESGMVARLGGDEFAILIERTTPDQVFVLADRVMATFRLAFEETGQKLHATASIGVAFAHSGQSADDALRNADLAMYRAKSEGRNRIEVFSPDLHHEFSRRLSAVAAVRQAIEDEALFIHFQPIVELETGRWVGAEALARLAIDDPQLASPGNFIAIAEEAGLIDELGEMILHRALHDAQGVAQRLPPSFFITVNVSPRQLLQPGLVRVLEAALRSSKWPAERLMLEITESTLMAVTEVSHGNLSRMRALGVRLALDDFGTGYSSLAQLGRERFDVLKIAKPFVDGLPGSADSAHMAQAIVRMAESLRMSVIAEGVEHPAQAEALRRMGCSYAQGYEFGQPMTAAELVRISASRLVLT